MRFNDTDRLMYRRRLLVNLVPFYLDNTVEPRGFLVAETKEIDYSQFVFIIGKIRFNDRLM